MTHQEALDTRAAERYQLDEMTELERHAFESHFFECAACAEDIRAGVLLAEAVRTQAAAETGPVRSFTRPADARPAARRRATVWLPLAAAAALAVVAGYQSLVVIPALRHMSGPQALTPVVLRPVSRGDLPVVAAGQTGLVSLALDVNVAPTGPELIYDVGPEGGATLLTGTAPAPQPGTPLLLVLPANTLTSGRYVLTLRDASDRSVELGAYRFIVQ
jgi:hypothetical protein